MLFAFNKKDYHDKLLYLAYQVLCEMGDLADKLTLSGAYAIYSSYFNGIYALSSSSRETSDLDIELFAKVGDLDYTKFQQVYTKVIKYTFGDASSVEFFDLKSRPNSATYSFKVTTEEYGVSSRLKIDFAESKGVRRFDITPLELSFVKKLSLSNELVDRRPKDKIDVCSLLVYFYADGVSKAHILNLLVNYNLQFNLNNDWCSEVAITKGIQSLSRFKPSPAIQGLSNEECLLWVQTLLLGLFSPNIPEGAVYRQGVWY